MNHSNRYECAALDYADVIGQLERERGMAESKTEAYKVLLRQALDKLEKAEAQINLWQQALGDEL